MEREPNFEDEKIRIWAAEAGEAKDEDFEGEPTALSLDVEREEIFESRAYHFQENPDTLLYLMNLVASQQRQAGAEPALDETFQAAVRLMGEIGFKFLAKRRKKDGLITSLLVGISLGRRRLLSRQEWVEEGEYRKAVQDFEAETVGMGLLAEPQVAALEEWRRYDKNLPPAVP